MKNSVIFSALFLAVSFGFCEPAVAQTTGKPNIVFIMADDLGYGELGCYGQTKIKTPNIDGLAKQGVSFTQHYSGAPVCAPSRCVLMTGQHLGHAEIRGNRRSGKGGKFPGQFPISDSVVTIAEVLKAAGYTNGAFGKWGLGPSDSTGSPMKHGFDRFYGYNCQRNAHSYYPPYLDSDETEVQINEIPVPGWKKQPEGEVSADTYRSKNYAPDLILNEAVKFIDNNKDKPFFLYLPFVEPHMAMQPPQEWIDQYPKSWDEKNGVYRGQNGYLPHPRPRAGYAAMISDMDEHVGTILAKLKQYGLEENTIVVFTSDNGPTHAAKDKRFHVGGADCEFFNSNGGLKGYKGSCYEGGIRIPCVVRWPGKVAPDTETEVPSYFADWFPTLAGIAGAELPKQQLDGVDLAAAMQGKTVSKRSQPMIWDFNGYGGISAIRDGKWKAVRRDLNKKKNQPLAWELYDLESDRNETTDLAAKHPEVIKRLEAAFLANRSVSKVFKVPFWDKRAAGIKFELPFVKSRKISQAKIVLKTLETASKIYKLNTGAFPKKLRDLSECPDGMDKVQWGGPYVETLDNDPWGNSYQYKSNEATNRVAVTSAGADGIHGNEDDVKK